MHPHHDAITLLDTHAVPISPASANGVPRTRISCRNSILGAQLGAEGAPGVSFLRGTQDAVICITAGNAQL